MTGKPYRKTENRHQLSLFADHLDQHITQNNPVRAIDAYISSLDFHKLGAKGYQASGSLRGQPAYNPADLLRLYLYGYLNGVRSSRKLEQECQRNIEMMWLMQHQRPSYKTIANFRKNHAELLVRVNRDFILLCRSLDLIGGDIVAIDGSFFHGNASKQSIQTRSKVKKQLKALETQITQYHQTLDQCDWEDDRQEQATTVSIEQLQAKQNALMQTLNELECSDSKQISRTDPDARLLSKGGSKVAGYNVQSVVDERHHLIIASEVTQEGNDQKQLYPMARQTKDLLDKKRLTVLADAGYYETENLHQCEENGITAYVPIPNKTAQLKQQKRFVPEDFGYDSEQDSYRCPNGAGLKPQGQPIEKSGKLRQRYISQRSDCDTCPIRASCLPPRGQRRTLYRSQYQQSADNHRARMEAAGAEKMKLRASLVEHPFGTLKMRAGWQHFLVRGLKKVKGEWSLMQLAYNFTRVLNILGLDRFLKCCKQLQEALLALFFYAEVMTN